MDLFAREIYVGIIGTRRRDTFHDFKLMITKFNEVYGWYASQAVVIVSGGCPEGGDRFAELIAKQYSLRTIILWRVRRQRSGASVKDSLSG